MCLNYNFANQEGDYESQVCSFCAGSDIFVGHRVIGTGEVAAGLSRLRITANTRYPSRFWERTLSSRIPPDNAIARFGVCGADGLKWGHAFGHIVLMPPLVSLISWLPASAILFVTRKVRPGAFEGPLVVVLAKFVAFAAIAVASLVLILGVMLRS